MKSAHEVTVYSFFFSYHLYKDDEYKGVKIKHICSAETWIGGSLGQFFYDFVSLKDALKRDKQIYMKCKLLILRKVGCLKNIIFATVAIFYWRTSCSYRLIVKLKI